MASTGFLLVMTPLLLMSLIVIASANDYGYTPKPDYHEEKPKPQEKPLPTKPDFENSHPAGVDELLPTIISIQGTVLCKLGSKYFALQGAIARITCVAIDEHGYETAPFSQLTDGCDANGYFFATLSGLKDSWKLKECKAFLHYSSLETCNVPVDVNHGLSGDLLYSYRILNNKHTKLYTVGPFFYTSESESAPSGGGGGGY
ncbi:hypothetical protein FH972_005871 [Carpinus fangiana]|uniref:Proline-rich protein 3-like n=1 Tax=Carpinus fangiana TaxID=176857 RepID=A0A5N6QQW8_9ROSI|nr:hypothetical protein FH972_005871 [Carpinus fangiana]